jgi:hypothetical protein
VLTLENHHRCDKLTESVERGFYTVPTVGKDFEVGHQVRLKTTLEPPANIPAGAIGSVNRVSDWDVWVRFGKNVVRLPMGEVEHA